MEFRAVSQETKMNYMLWSIKKEIRKENKYLASLPFDPSPIIGVVKYHLDQWDPIQLLEDGSQDDEYDGEARSVTIYIIKHMEEISVAGLGQEIQSIFRKSFLDEFQSDEDTFEIAIGILRDLTNGNEDVSSE
ncbi:hypothetical protein PAECIP111891_02391 [Paenibacillus allorhizoplanae]|uniref:Uncharacterized protein n=1 Tax=Paenibacillus allorhizoplanae TaxID=2905648 RepID=A0ABN8G9S2_9BACL|nr:DUF1871 family protein [Paenibacillus allorhizoplanae]CAH1203683.1 hypothetical protein PAECIP111891_02391 [Paenibacillus allorhizoplanae]